MGDLIKILTTKNIDITKKDSKENTAFHIAAKSGNVAGITAIFETIKEKKIKHLSSKNQEVPIIYQFILMSCLLLIDCNNFCNYKKNSYLEQNSSTIGSHLWIY